MTRIRALVPIWGLAVLFISGSEFAVSAQQKTLRWGGDKAGGAPYIYDDEKKGPVGFEWELASYLAAEIGRTPKFEQLDWDNLPETLERGDIDIAFNGMEFRPEWEAKYPSTLPYFIFRLRLIARVDDASLRSWADLRVPVGKPKKRVGVQRGSRAESYMRETFKDAIDLVPVKEVDETLQLVEDGKRLDATVQDSPVAVYYVMSGRLPKLHVIGEPVDPGYYVILTSNGQKPEEAAAAAQLRAQLNDAIRKGFASGVFEEIYRRYGLWDTEQERLAYIHLKPWPPGTSAAGDQHPEPAAKRTLGSIKDKLADATWMTIALAFCSMPLAIVLGILIAISRLYGPGILRIPLTLYVEVVRGTPILLQMYVWFFLTPQVAKMIDWQPLIWITTLPPFIVGVFALAVNYSAYEAENFRAGLQAIPKGQMEAALSLGIAPLTAIRKIILPQAVRIVIPSVTNDFIALFKDTSVCSMILITELTGLYYQNKYDRDLVLQLAFAIGLIYLLMSYPLSLLSGWLERRLPGWGVMPMIVVADLVKKFGSATILDGVSLEVKRGEVAAIIGPSGGGKSTLLRCINALESFQGGRIAVEDLCLEPAVRTGPSKRLLLQLRRKVGMVFQQFNLFPHLTALENVMAGPLYAVKQKRAEAEALAHELLKRVGLGDKAGAKPGRLSGGQQQRVAIARALAVKPAAILFDEPTSALDPKMAEEVLSVITDLAKAGQTMIVVTHLMNFARRVSHQIHVMSSGKVVESGPPERVFADPRHEVTREFLRQANA